MRQLKRVLLLVHPENDPRKVGYIGAERDVWRDLTSKGFHIGVLYVPDTMRELMSEIEGFAPDFVFNFLEEFQGEGVYDFAPIAYLESAGIPFSGCHSRGLVISRNKIWTTALAQAVGIRTPWTQLATRGFRYGGPYPAFVKYCREHASLGVTRKNRVLNWEQMRAQIRRMKSNFDGEVLAQEFVAGQEVTVSVLGGKNPLALVPWRLGLPSGHSIATERVKFNSRYRVRKKIRAYRYRGDAASVLMGMSCQLFEQMDLSGYVRFDFRLNEESTPFLIDVNANPNLAKDEDFVRSAGAAGIGFSELIDRIVEIGFSYAPRR